MSKFWASVFFNLLLNVVSFHSWKSPSCPPNQEFVPCIDLCNSRSIPCVSGCDCIPGYTRNATGHCIPEKDCPGEIHSFVSTSCPPNQMLVRCINWCNFHSTPCVSGCDCKAGYVRNAFGDCVLEEVRPVSFLSLELSSCPPNQEFVPCMNWCNFHSKPCISACDCIPGYIRNETAHCIPEKGCPVEIHSDASSPCPPNQRFVRCLKWCNFRSKPCISACDCIQGYHRNGFGDCILDKDSPAAG